MMRSDQHKDTFIYGIHAVMEAITAGKEIERILIQKNLINDQVKEIETLAIDHQFPINKVPVEKLNRITKKSHQGVVAIISPITYASLDHVISNVFSKGHDPLIVILDRITDVRNFGAICRTAESAGVHAIVIPEKGGALMNADAVKTSAGALHHIPVCREKDLYKTMLFLKDSGLRVIACTEKAESLSYSTDLTGPLAVAFGSEEDGLSSFILKKADQMIRIPMFGKVESLNVSVSVGVVLYEVIRQRSV